MSFSRVLGRILVCLVLEMGALSGAVRPEDIEQIMKLSEPCVTQTLGKKEGDEDPEDP